VEVAYLREPTPDYVRTAAEVVNNIHTHNGLGDIMVFLTGREEIERCLQYLSEMTYKTHQHLIFSHSIQGLEQPSSFRCSHRCSQECGK